MEGEAMNAPLSYTVHYLPPAYPAKCRPFKCRHEPQFVMQHAVHIVPAKRGGSKIEIDHSVCLACGLPQGCTVGGNVLVDLQMLWGRFGFHPAIGDRVLELRDKWSRIASYLFDARGWNGKHARIARLIDPNLTMKLKLQRIKGQPRRITRGTTRMAVITFDREYLRETRAS
jgi:hypothetical protein